jgi:hypothetical protein
MDEAESESVRDRVVRLVFHGDEHRFDQFIEELRDACPADSQVILRGSAVTGTRWADGQPFDADGPGSSDLDVTFLSGDMLDLWEEFYIPKMHTVPLNDENPEVCPSLAELRERLCRLAGRPVNLQASRNIVQFTRDVLWDQPYITLIEKSDENARETSAS